jgi:hypothetical protein
MSKKRDYKAEYERRIRRGEARGLSRSQARGHARPDEKPASKLFTPKPFERRLEDGIKEMRRGKPLTKAARAIAVSSERLRKYASSTGVAKRAGRQWRIGPDKRKRVLPIFSDGQLQIITVPDFVTASRVGQYMSAVNQFLDTNDEYFLDEFAGGSVIDVRGRRFAFETNPNTLYWLNESQTKSFEEIYRITV